MTRRLIVGLLPVAAAAALVCLVPAHARAQDCFADMRDCFNEAAGQDTFLGIWLGGLDCEWSFVTCARSAMVGR